MASKFLLLLFTILLFISSSSAHLSVDTSLKLMADALEWPTTTSLIESATATDIDDDELDLEQDPRRSLFWRRVHYYISYGALAANRIPCPPRSGRPYYTHNCYKARGPVNPYSRGCSAITRCRR
ncbi:protein RALF-like 34 [Benincasa hispida]|uniref:protein RALF-like 34 n=1 Tax=Benincasa hispida TaxID=102211 RepID=UPI001902560E|nr:protein RALF-like 34 [Benincasa hispida]